MRSHLSEQLLAGLSEFVTARFGLHFPPKRWRDLERRIGPAARDFGFKDVADCVAWLITTTPTPEQTEILARQLTIGETYFFREQKSFEALERTILPELIGARRGKDQRLRIWSAGCSTGEEPYSLAILLSRLIPDLNGWNVTILATDLNAQAVARARRGIYRDWSFRGTAAWLKEKYFSRTGDGGFEIHAAIRNMVTFACLNLAEDSYPSLSNNTNAIDVIFCRNVLMYFEAEQARQVIGSFRRALLAGGWLVVSPCETSADFTGFATVPFPEALLYRKVGDGWTVPAMPFPEAAGEAVIIPPHLPEQVWAPPSGLSPLPSPPPAEETASTSDLDEAEALYREGRYAETADTLAAFVAMGLPEGRLLCSYGKAAALLARTFANLGRLSDALLWSEKAIAAAKLDPGLHYLRATIFQELGEPEKSIVSLRRAIYLDHGFALAHFALGNLTLKLGKSREADRHFGNALELLRTHPAGEPLDGAEGITVARLTEIVTALRESTGVR